MKGRKNFKFDEGDLTGDMYNDTKLLKSKFEDMGLSPKEIDEALDGVTVHHVEDGKTLQLVRSDVHDAFKHTGGRSVIQDSLLSSVASGSAGFLAPKTMKEIEEGGSVPNGVAADIVSNTGIGTAYDLTLGQLGEPVSRIMDESINHQERTTDTPIGALNNINTNRNALLKVAKEMGLTNEE